MKRRRHVAARGADPGLVGTLTESGIVGTWEWDPASGRFILDEGAAGLLAGDARLAGRPMHGERATAGLDGPDVARFLAEMHRAADEGDAVLIELGVACLRQGPRRLLCRGRIHRDERRQPVRGEGTLVDVADIGAEARALLGLEEDQAGDAIDEAAELLIAARQAIDASGNPKLRELVDLLLLEVAREIASRTRLLPRIHH